MKELFLQVLDTSIFASLLIGIIIFSSNRFLIKYTHRFSYLLSLVIIVRMLFVTKIEINIPIINSIFRNKEGIDNLKNYLLVSVPANNQVIDYLGIISKVWIIGLVIIISYYAYFQFTFYFKVKRVMKPNKNDKLQKLLDDQLTLSGISKDIKVNIVEGLSTPSLVGILKNTIILPNNNYTEKELKWIFNHELIHLKRKDNLLKLLMIFALAIHWFNPLVYILRRFFYEQCELSCDEQVIRNAEIQEIKEYALLLVNSVKYKNGLKVLAISSELTNKKINIMKRRIDSMLNLKTKKSGVLFGIITLLIVGGSIFAINTSDTFADTPEDNSVKNYTFTETPVDAKEIPHKDGIESVLIKSDSIVVQYSDGQVEEFSNDEYQLKAEVLE